MQQTDISAFLRQFEYQFSDHELIEEAFRHSSYVNEQLGSHLRDNERLEFLGDAVLNLVVGHILMVRFPKLHEGDLSRMRANLVNETQLARIARTFQLGTYIQLGKGERQTDGQEKNSILANTFEAVLAAVYLDGGYQEAFRIIETHFTPLLENRQGPSGYQDYKSQLQELVQLNHQQIPSYRVIEESGPDHDKTFKVQLTASDIVTEGSGKSKKLAEQDAARKALEILKVQAPIKPDSIDSHDTD